MEASPEKSEDCVGDEHDEEDVVDDAPDAGCHAGEATVEERDGDFDDANRGEEEDLADYSELESVC